MYGEAVLAAMQAVASSLSGNPLSFINQLYGKSRKGTKPKKSKAVQKRRKANKQAAKQRQANRK